MKRHVIYVVLILAVLAMAVLTSAPHGQDRVQIEREPERLVQEVIHITNAERSARGLGGLKEQPALRKAAEWMAEDMARHNYFNHTDSRGRDIVERLRAFGYDDARLMAENIEKGPESAQAAVQGWLSSPPHRRNLLDPEVRDVGVGYAVDPRDRRLYWVLDLGARFASK